jgi:taurine dioxygenase
MELIPITSFIGTEVKGVDLREPVSDADFAAMRGALNQTSLLLFRGQSLDEARHVEFSR